MSGQWLGDYPWWLSRCVMPNAEGDSRAQFQADRATIEYVFRKVSMLVTLPLADDRGRCRAGWIAACTTVLCLQFDSPTLGPHFPIPRPIALLSGCITSHRVASHHVGSHHLMSGRITSCRVASHRVGLCHIASGRVRLHRIVSGCIASRRVASHRVALHHVRSRHVVSVALLSSHVALLSTLFGALSLPAIIPLLAHSLPALSAKV